MTLTLRIKNTDAGAHAAIVTRDGEQKARIEPGKEFEVTLWEGAPLTVTETAAAPLLTQLERAQRGRNDLFKLGADADSVRNLDELVEFIASLPAYNYKSDPEPAPVPPAVDVPPPAPEQPAP